MTQFTNGQNVNHNGKNMQVVNVHQWSVPNGSRYEVNEDATNRLREVGNDWETIHEEVKSPLQFEEVALYSPETGVIKIFI